MANDTPGVDAIVLSKVKKIIKNVSHRAVEDDTLLLATRVLDSVNVVQLLSELERGFNITFAETDMFEATFASPIELAKVCLARLAAKKANG
jgi:acyl carrier protein